MQNGERRAAYLFVFPAVLFMLAFIGYPIAYNIVMSFQKVDIMTLKSAHRDFIGLSNFREIFSTPVLSVSIVNTVLYTLGCLFFQFTIGFALAVFFNLGFSSQDKLRGLLTVAWMMPSTVVALLFKFMLSPSSGIINYILVAIGVVDKPIDWLISQKTAMWGVIIANSWVGIPFNLILLSTGLCGIPAELYESASIDGASGIRKFFSITVPMLRPAIYSVLVLGFIYTFKVFDLIYVMTNGGPVNATEVLSTYSYKLSFVMYKFSEGAASANVLFACLFVVSLGYLKLIREEEEIQS
jgi:multiple sugar transport system permease protein